MSETLKQTEAIPVSYPAVDGVMGDDLATAWQRIEHHIAWRYSPRTVVWHVQSDGCEWQAPLAPVVAISAQIVGQSPVEPDTGLLGGWILPCGLVTVTATVGTDPVPAAVSGAIKRYAKFMSSSAALPAGVTRFSSGDFDVGIRRDQIDPAKALLQSGAADLLRAFRRV